MNLNKITADLPKKERYIKLTRPSGLHVKVKISLVAECLARPGWQKGWIKKPELPKEQEKKTKTNNMRKIK
jgi:hypothetical protein